MLNASINMDMLVIRQACAKARPGAWSLFPWQAQWECPVLPRADGEASLSRTRFIEEKPRELGLRRVASSARKGGIPYCKQGYANVRTLQNQLS